jgi:hypothetical protein
MQPFSRRHMRAQAIDSGINAIVQAPTWSAKAVMALARRSGSGRRPPPSLRVKSLGRWYKIIASGHGLARNGYSIIGQCTPDPGKQWPHIAFDCSHDLETHGFYESFCALPVME